MIVYIILSRRSDYYIIKKETDDGQAELCSCYRRTTTGEKPKIEVMEAVLKRGVSTRKLRDCFTLNSGPLLENSVCPELAHLGH